MVVLGDSSKIDAVVSISLLRKVSLHIDRILMVWWKPCSNSYCVDGFRVMVTECGELTAPLLSVTVRLNVSGVEVETVGAGNVRASRISSC